MSEQIESAFGDFWQPRSLDELAREQGVKPFTFLPSAACRRPAPSDEESTDDFLAAIFGFSPRRGGLMSNYCDVERLLFADDWFSPCDGPRRQYERIASSFGKEFTTRACLCERHAKVLGWKEPAR